MTDMRWRCVRADRDSSREGFVVCTSTTCDEASPDKTLRGSNCPACGSLLMFAGPFARIEPRRADA